MLASFTPESQAAQELAETNPMGLIPPPDPRESEDCLFLDVLVPTKVFEKRRDKDYKGAPVMVWIYGGGFTFTDDSGNPAGLIRRSQEHSDDYDGIIYVKMNYRVSVLNQIALTTEGSQIFRPVLLAFFQAQTFKVMALQMWVFWTNAWLLTGYRKIFIYLAAIQSVLLCSVSQLALLQSYTRSLPTVA